MCGINENQKKYIFVYFFFGFLKTHYDTKQLDNLISNPQQIQCILVIKTIHAHQL